MVKARKGVNRFWSIAMTIVCVLWMYPIFMVLMISLKTPTLRPKPLQGLTTMWMQSPARASSPACFTAYL